MSAMGTSVSLSFSLFTFSTIFHFLSSSAHSSFPLRLSCYNFFLLPFLSYFPFLPSLLALSYLPFLSFIHLLSFLLLDDFPVNRCTCSQSTSCYNILQGHQQSTLWPANSTFFPRARIQFLLSSWSPPLPLELNWKSWMCNPGLPVKLSTFLHFLLSFSSLLFLFFHLQMGLQSVYPGQGRVLRPLSKHLHSHLNSWLPGCSSPRIMWIKRGPCLSTWVWKCHAPPEVHTKLPSSNTHNKTVWRMMNFFVILVMFYYKFNHVCQKCIFRLMDKVGFDILVKAEDRAATKKYFSICQIVFFINHSSL